jgi:hypothetical protein
MQKNYMYLHYLIGNVISNECYTNPVSGLINIFTHDIYMSNFHSNREYHSSGQEPVIHFSSPLISRFNTEPKSKSKSKSKSKLLYDWRSVSQYVLVSGTPLGPMTRFYFFLSFCSVSCTFFIYYVKAKAKESQLLVCVTKQRLF